MISDSTYGNSVVKISLDNGILVFLKNKSPGDYLSDSMKIYRASTFSGSKMYFIGAFRTLTDRLSNSAFLMFVKTEADLTLTDDCFDFPVNYIPESTTGTYFRNTFDLLTS